MNISSKITLYDFLCMLVCGYLILYILRNYCYLPCEDEILFYILSYIVGMIYHKILYAVCSKFHILGNMKCMVLCSREKVEQTVENKLTQSRDMKGYYEDYYYLVQKKCLGNIPILEAQAAFCKALIPIVFLPLIMKLICSCCTNLACTVCIAILGLVGLVVAWGSTQMKIHELVWEGAYYLKKLEKEKNEKSNS